MLAGGVIGSGAGSTDDRLWLDQHRLRLGFRFGDDDRLRLRLCRCLGDHNQVWLGDRDKLGLGDEGGLGFDHQHGLRFGDEDGLRLGRRDVDRLWLGAT